MAALAIAGKLTYVRTRPRPKPPATPLAFYAAALRSFLAQALRVRGKGYSFEDMATLLTNLDTELEKRNKGATAVLKQFGLHPTDAA